MATSRIRLDLNALAPYIDKLGPRARSAAERGLVSAVMRGRTLLIQRTRSARPASSKPGIPPGAFNTGNFLRSWKTMTLGGAALLFNSAPYAGVVEHGRRPGARRPPTAPIARWAQRKLGLSPEQAELAALPIARAIARRGLRGRGILTGAMPELTRITNAEVLRELVAEIHRRSP